ncbi:MAG: 30S ribosomal protein S4 [Parachlamydiales bacterium]|nr:30S ribosomal protein S4 [Parachlamydiales bacterium]
MARYTGPKNRVARRFGANIFGRTRNPLLHKPNPPGMHGSRHKKKSDYGVQLEEKQKLKAVYGMVSEKQLINYYQKSLQHSGETAENFLAMLECRLDNMVYRMKFARTIFMAQQLVSHGHIYVNGKKVDRRSFQVKPGMIISVKEKSRKNEGIKLSADHALSSVPEYVLVEKDKFEGKLLAVPAVDQISFPLPINISMICDFLAHSH